MASAVGHGTPSSMSPPMSLERKNELLDAVRGRSEMVE
jgi:hypothetical protein